MDGVCLTFDIDWAPDCVIDAVAEELVRRGIRATWFVTHGSAAVERLRAEPGLFELGLHPNFLPGSSHGSTVESVLAACAALVPGATSLRSHGLVQSTGHLAAIMQQTGVLADVSLLLPDAAHVQPFVYRWEGRELLRIPYVWEDDFEMQRRAPRWQAGRLVRPQTGPMILDFHPIHVVLNSCDLSAYARLKRRCPRLEQAQPRDLSDLVQTGAGAQTVFRELLDRFEPRSFLTIDDLGRRWTSGANRAEGAAA